MIERAKFCRALDGRIDAHSQLKCLLWGFRWERPWVCLLISSFIPSRNYGDRSRAKQAGCDEKSGITEHEVVTDDRRPGVETESEVSWLHVA